MVLTLKNDCGDVLARGDVNVGNLSAAPGALLSPSQASAALTTTSYLLRAFSTPRSARAHRDAAQCQVEERERKRL